MRPCDLCLANACVGKNLEECLGSRLAAVCAAKALHNGGVNQADDSLPRRVKVLVVIAKIDYRLRRREARTDSITSRVFGRGRGQLPGGHVLELVLRHCVFERLSIQRRDGVPLKLAKVVLNSLGRNAERQIYRL